MSKLKSTVDITNKVLKKVIILEIGLRNGDNRGVFCDDFKCHSKKYVKDLVKSVDFSW